MSDKHYKITPNRNAFGDITSYSVDEVDSATIQANGTVADWMFKGSLIFWIFPIISACILLSPVIFFVSRHLLKKYEGRLGANDLKILKIAKKLSLGVLIWMVFCWVIMLIGATVLLLQHIGVIDVPILRLIVEQITGLF